MRDCVIVCGYPTNADGSLSPILESRIAMGVKLIQSGLARYLLVSGGAVHNAYSEAQAMYQWAIAQGVPKSQILIEDQAISTYHNMYYAAQMMKAHGLSTCYVVTNSWHLIKARYYARKFHLNYKLKACQKPKEMNRIVVFGLILYMPINMLVMRLKGYK